MGLFLCALDPRHKPWPQWSLPGAGFYTGTAGAALLAIVSGFDPLSSPPFSRATYGP